MSPAQNNSEEFPPAPNNTREPTPARDPTSEEPTPVAEGSHNPAHRGISSTAPPMTKEQNHTVVYNPNDWQHASDVCTAKRVAGDGSVSDGNNTNNPYYHYHNNDNNNNDNNNNGGFSSNDRACGRGTGKF